jgi:ABC-type glycerol-3-phosphate transport system substrate-binding protein
VFNIRKGALRRPALAVTITAAVALTLTACSGSGSSGTSTSGSATSGNLSWWGWSQASEVNTYIKAFNKTYPNIHVKYKQLAIDSYVAALRPAAASQQSPDLFDIQPGAQVTEFGPFADDMAPIIAKKLGSDWKSKVAPIGVSGLEDTSGKLTALSVGAVYAGPLWINSTIFQKYGLKAPTTLTEWSHDCTVLKQNNQGCFVQGAADEGFNQDTLQAIADSVQPGAWTKASKGDIKWTDPSIVKTFTIWKELFTDGIMQPGAAGAQQYPDANNDFLSQKYGMVMMGTWYNLNATTAGMTSSISGAGVTDPKPFPIVPVPFPDVAGTGHGAALFGDSGRGVAIAKKSKQQAAATTFVDWLTASKPGQTVVADQLDTVPALNGVSPDWNTVKMPDKSVQEAPIQKIYAQTAHSDEPREALLSAGVQTAILNASTSVATGTATPEQATQTLQQAAVTAGEKFK